MKIETERLIITDFTPDMARQVHQNSLDEDNRRFVPDEVFESMEEAKETLSYLISQYGSKQGPQAYPVIRKETAENIGYVQMVPVEEGKWEVGYHIAKVHTGKGYATEAVKAFLPVITDVLGIDEVLGICLKENAASHQVLNKCGFVPLFEGEGNYQGEKREIYRSVWRKRTMRLLFEMDKKDYGNCTHTFVRDSARSIIIRDHRVAMIHSLKYDFYKFPGGGIEKGEDPTIALIRETREEAGLVIRPETIREYGYVHRIQKSDSDETECFVQDNFYYFCEAEEETVSQELDQYEEEENYFLEFADPEAVIRKNRNAQNSPYNSAMLEREARVLELLIEENYL